MNNVGRIEKTVFISYGRIAVSWAQSIFQDLTQHGYDVFFDFHGIASGGFEEIILENIKARAHFLVLLTPSALERCSDPTDLFRREIETAIAVQRNIVPIMLEGFDFGAPDVDNQLGNTLAALKRYNGLPIHVAYIPEAMERLRQKYLNCAARYGVTSRFSIRRTSRKGRTGCGCQRASCDGKRAEGSRTTALHLYRQSQIPR